jgi:hypothetical protein
MSDIISRSL